MSLVLPRKNVNVFICSPLKIGTRIFKIRKNKVRFENCVSEEILGRTSSKIIGVKGKS